MGKRSFEFIRGTPVVVDGRKLGEVRGKFYYRQVYGSRHFLRQPGGIAFLVASLDAAEGLGARIVVVVDRETNKIYRAKLADLREYGARVSRGFGEQLALTFEHWQTEQPF